MFGIGVLWMALGAWALAAFSAWRCRVLYRSGKAYWSEEVIGERTGFPVWFRVTLGFMGTTACVLALTAVYLTRQLPQAFSAEHHQSDKEVQGLDLSSRIPQTLREIFQQDFDHTLQANKDVTVTPVRGGVQQANVTVQGRLYVDLDSMAKFIGFFVPMSAEWPAMVIATLADHPERILTLQGHVSDRSGGQHANSENVAFSGRVYVYYEGLLSVREIADLHELYRRKGLSLELRGSDYAARMRESATAVDFKHGAVANIETGTQSPKVDRTRMEVGWYQSQPSLLGLSIKNNAPEPIGPLGITITNMQWFSPAVGRYVARPELHEHPTLAFPKTDLIPESRLHALPGEQIRFPFLRSEQLAGKPSLTLVTPVGRSGTRQYEATDTGRWRIDFVATLAKDSREHFCEIDWDGTSIAVVPHP